MYIHTLLEDTGFATNGELRTALLDQSDWRGRIHVVRASVPPPTFKPVNNLAPVVQTLDSAIHRINHYPADKCYGTQLRYPRDSDLSGG